VGHCRHGPHLLPVRATIAELGLGRGVKWASSGCATGTGSGIRARDGLPTTLSWISGFGLNSVQFRDPPARRITRASREDHKEVAQTRICNNVQDENALHD
jgi:hypothetical protein